jgi:hypothetical protein
LKSLRPYNLQSYLSIRVHMDAGADRRMPAGRHANLANLCGYAHLRRISENLDRYTTLRNLEVNFLPTRIAPGWVGICMDLLTAGNYGC